MKGTIKFRQWVEVNTDPQRRCYDGYHYSSEWMWTRWSDLEVNVSPERVEFWRSLNAYAVKERGKSALREYEWQPNQGEPL